MTCVCGGARTFRGATDEASLRLGERGPASMMVQAGDGR